MQGKLRIENINVTYIKMNNSYLSMGIIYDMGKS